MTPTGVALMPRALRRLEAVAPSLVRLLPACALGAGFVVAVIGLALHHGGVDLGTWLPPFNMRWDPRLDPHARDTAIVFAVALVTVPLLVWRLPSGAPFALMLYALTLVLGLALNLAAEGVRGWWAMFATGHNGSFEGRFEYIPGLPLLNHGVGYFLAHFGPLLHYATTHIKGNPPGPLIIMHLLGLDSPARLSIFCVLVGSLCAPLAYDLGRTVGDEQRGRIAGVLTAFTPSLLLVGFSSMDFAFAAMGMIAACLLIRPQRPAVAAGAVAFAFASFCSWLLFAIPAFSALVVLQRRGWRAAAEVAAASVLALLAFNGALALISGYDPFSALQATSGYYHHGVANQRPYLFWVVGSPTAWALMLGLPVVWCVLRSAGMRDPVAVAVVAMILAASLLGLTKAETERIWLPFAPLACVAASATLARARLTVTIVALAAQAIAVELLFFTIW